METKKGKLVTAKKVKLGDTGETVRANIKRRREAENLSYAELSRRLEEIGNPIPPLGLRRIEAGERKVDVDDLVALALILGTTPAYLLMPWVDTRDDLVDVTGRSEIPSGDVWDWLTSLRAGIGESDKASDRVRGFLRSRPTWELEQFYSLLYSRASEGDLESMPDALRNGLEQLLPDGREDGRGDD